MVTCLLWRAESRHLYALILLLAAYLLNQLDRYLLPVVTKPLAQELQYGDLACMVNTTVPAAQRHGIICNATDQLTCGAETSAAGGPSVCQWDYNGQGMLYQLLAGPVFIVVYSVSGVVLAVAADAYNRVTLLAVCLALWSAVTLLTGAVSAYWQLAVLRFGLGITEAGCTPFAMSLLSDYFGPDLRAAAIGFYNWGIYMGYSLAYLIGNFITEANILGQGWRWAFYVSGVPGLLLAALLLLTVPEPPSTRPVASLRPRRGCWPALRDALAPFTHLPVIVLCIAGSVRNAAGYVWAYNTQPYFEAIGEDATTVGSYMSWIPLVGGSIGVVSGGIISDRLVRRLGARGRLLVLICSQFMAVPFVVGALYLSPPYAYLSLIPGYIIGEMWVGITLTVLVELVPPSQKTSAVAMYLFIIANVGGNLPLLVPPLKSVFTGYGLQQGQALRASLYVLYPGLYLLGALIYILTMCLLPKYPSQQGYEEIPDIEDSSSRKKS